MKLKNGLGALLLTGTALLTTAAVADDSLCSLQSCISIQQIVDANRPNGSFPPNFLLNTSSIGITGLDALRDPYVASHFQESFYKFWEKYIKPQKTPIGFTFYVDKLDSSLLDQATISPLTTQLQWSAQLDLQNNTHLGQLKLNLPSFHSSPGALEDAGKVWGNFLNNIYYPVTGTDNQIPVPALACPSLISDSDCEKIKHMGNILDAHAQTKKNLTTPPKVETLTLDNKADIEKIVRNSIENAKKKDKTTEIHFTMQAAATRAMDVLANEKTLPVETIISSHVARDTPHDTLKRALLAGTYVYAKHKSLCYQINSHDDGSADVDAYRFHNGIMSNHIFHSHHFKDSETAMTEIKHSIAQENESAQTLRIAPLSRREA